MEILNISELLDVPQDSPHFRSRKFLLELLKTGIDAVDPFELVIRNLDYISDLKLLQIGEFSFNLQKRTIWVIGAGKAVGRMAEAIEIKLPDCTLSGLICVPEGIKKDLSLKQIQCLESTHPIPSEKNIQNTMMMLELIKQIKPSDLVISLISGGGSALWSAPIPPISIADLEKLNLTLIRSGMSIHEINIIRKHLSLIKGGKLAQLIPSEIITLAISDVIGDNFDTIASGPFSPDDSTFHTVLETLEKYNLDLEGLPSIIYQVIAGGLNGKIPDTPNLENTVFKRVYSFLLGSNMIARNSISIKAEKLGIKVIDKGNLIEGDARYIGKEYALQGLRNLQDKTIKRQPILYLSGGEPTIIVKGNGVGGRNQELIGSFLEEINKIEMIPDLVLLSAGTDGIDGNSQYAGAICDHFTLRRIKEKKLPIDEYQKNNDMSQFFQLLGKSLILTGPTGTNVMDIHLLLVNASKLK